MMRAITTARTADAATPTTPAAGVEIPAAMPLPGLARPQRRLLAALAGVLLLGLLAGLATGTQGLSPLALWTDLHGEQAGLVIGQIRAPRTLGAVLAGGLLGLAGALAQGVFRNPLADPYLLGSAAGAALGVVLVLAGAAFAGAQISLATVAWLERAGLTGAAFVGAVTGVAGLFWLVCSALALGSRAIPALGAVASPEADRTGG